MLVGGPGRTVQTRGGGILVCRLIHINCTSTRMIFINHTRRSRLLSSPGSGESWSGSLVWPLTLWVSISQVANQWKGSGKLEEGQHMPSDRRKEIWNWIKCKWKWQTGGRQKGSSTAAPSALTRGLSMTKSKLTYWVNTVDDTNYVHLSPLPMKMFATICLRSSIPWV